MTSLATRVNLLRLRLWAYKGALQPLHVTRSTVSPVPVTVEANGCNIGAASVFDSDLLLSVRSNGKTAHTDSFIFGSAAILELVGLSAPPSPYSPEVDQTRTRSFASHAFGWFAFLGWITNEPNLHVNI